MANARVAGKARGRTMSREVKVTATEFSRNFGRYQDRAMEGAVVKVTSHDRLVGGFISPAELERYERLKRRERKSLVVGDLPGDVVGAIERAEYGKRVR
ncbi:MAG: hypothetical protein WD076_07955 [Parvularculaceae bacterium]